MRRVRMMAWSIATCAFLALLSGSIQAGKGGVKGKPGGSGGGGDGGTVTTRVAYCQMTRQDNVVNVYEVFIADTDGRNRMQVTSAGDYLIARTLAWSPDGRFFAVWSNGGLGLGLGAGMQVIEAETGSAFLAAPSILSDWSSRREAGVLAPAESQLLLNTVRTSSGAWPWFTTMNLTVSPPDRGGTVTQLTHHEETLIDGVWHACPGV